MAKTFASLVIGQYFSFPGRPSTVFRKISGTQCRQGDSPAFEVSDGSHAGVVVRQEPAPKKPRKLAAVTSLADLTYRAGRDPAYVMLAQVAASKLGYYQDRLGKGVFGWLEMCASETSEAAVVETVNGCLGIVAARLDAAAAETRAAMLPARVARSAKNNAIVPRPAS